VDIVDCYVYPELALAIQPKTCRIQYPTYCHRYKQTFEEVNVTVVSESGMNDVVEVTDCDAVEVVKISEVGCARASLVVVTYIVPPTWLSKKFAESSTKTTLPDGACEMKLHISFPVNLITERVHLTCIIPVMHYSEQEQIANEIIQILLNGQVK